MRPIILASSSPRRREILEQVGVKFQIIPSDKEEIITQSIPSEVVKDLASMKANDVVTRLNHPSIVLGADTIVVYDGKIMGKPKDNEDAKNMIMELQDDVHEVYTGVSIIILDLVSGQFKKKEINFYERTKVTVAPMSEEEIEEYIATKEPLDKAGAYAIQGQFALYIKQIEGDYFNVVGLPIARIYEELLKVGIRLKG